MPAGLVEITNGLWDFTDGSLCILGCDWVETMGHLSGSQLTLLP